MSPRGNSIWRLTGRGEFLRTDHPLTLADAALEYAGPLSYRWASLAEALRPGDEWTKLDIFGEVAQNRPRIKTHHRMLRSYARHDYRAVPDALGLHGNERIIDAGGGLGTLANLMLDAHPQVRVTVLDRPEVVELAVRGQPQRSGLDWRATDLFDPWPIEADAVILSRVLHDWDDGAAVRILSRARAVLPKGGRLFVVEMLLPDNDAAGALCDLHLLVATGGQERTVDEYQRLFEDSGFEWLEVRAMAALPSVLVGVAK